MFDNFRDRQFELFNYSRNYFKHNPEKLVNIEYFITKHIQSFISDTLTNLVSDYNEASCLYPFWQNYPPDERGRGPIGDQFPWIEVGEHVFGPKLSRYLSNNFSVRDIGLPTGPDERYVLTSDKIKDILEITDSLWLFIDIKSVGPRDDQDHVVMSHNQVSGNGKWDITNQGVLNDILIARGLRVCHDFHCAIPPIFVLSDETIAPVIQIVIKPVYKMLSLHGVEKGQPLDHISIISIPNGILLVENPNYLSTFPGLLFPGKDDKGKDPRKIRARVSFSLLRKIADWRYSDLQIHY